MPAFSGNGYLISMMRRGAAPVVPLPPRNLPVRSAVSNHPLTSDLMQSAPQAPGQVLSEQNAGAEQNTASRFVQDRFADGGSPIPEIDIEQDSTQVIASPAISERPASKDREPVRHQPLASPAENVPNTIASGVDAVALSIAEESAKNMEGIGLSSSERAQGIVELKLPKNFYARATPPQSSQKVPKLGTDAEQATVVMPAQPKPASQGLEQAPLLSVVPLSNSDVARISSPAAVTEKPGIAIAPVSTLEPVGERRISVVAPVSMERVPAEEKPKAKETRLGEQLPVPGLINAAAKQERGVPVSHAQPTPAATIAQPKLRINHIDVQVVNQLPAQQPAPANSPNNGRLLERRYLHQLGLEL